MIERGKLIVLEGIDYAGKGTQLKLLEKSLLERGIPYTMIDFPRHGQNHYAYVVDRYLADKSGEKVDPYFVTLSYAGDRALGKPLINCGLDYGKLVTLGRYVSSNAYSAAELPPEEREGFLKWSNEFEYYKNGLPREDLVILLDTPVKVAQQRINNKPDKNERDLRLQQEVSSVYKNLLESEPNWVAVQTQNKSELGINSEILKTLDKRNLLPKVYPLDVYFGCSIQGESGGDGVKKTIIGLIRDLGHHVLSEMFISEDINLRRGRQLQDDEVYADDIYMMHRAKVKVMDVSRISLGVGYEIGWSLAKNERVIGLCEKSRWDHLSKMIKGNTEPNFALYSWESEDDVQNILRMELGEVNNG
ncbi:hypothetical protein HYW46_01800 [Candidatus Daviesbacteria bacterium]|nr:hypothetical protein [Candidatus Daviesbacteria bacterium]